MKNGPVKTFMAAACLICFILIGFRIDAQIVINEASSRNYTQIIDEDGEYNDWFELYNISEDTVNLADWAVTDDLLEQEKWVFPFLKMPPGDHLLIFASGKDRRIYVESLRWESPVLPEDMFRYIVPDASTPVNWNSISFNDDSWGEGQAGFGYGDGDDNTLVPAGTPAVYVRRTFNIPDTSVIEGALCHVDFDDGFVAYLNGTEICRYNISGTPAWNSWSSGLREATMYGGGMPEKYEIDKDFLSGILVQGENVFAIEVHNTSATSSDMSLIPFLSFAISGEDTFFQPAPEWILSSTRSNLHTNFKISSEGETIYLFDREPSLADSLFVERTSLNYSVGRATDGSPTIAIFMNATPGTSNNSSVAYTAGYEPMPQLSQAAGFYSGAIEVQLSVSSATAEIRYTLDGSEPDVGSILYSGNPVRITETASLRARAFSRAGKLPGSTATATYFINEEYTVPVLSVNTDNENLYGTTGIFTNWQESWNKPCYVEYFDTDKMLAFKQQAGMQVDGGAGGSRSQPQHSFRIEPGHGTFGEGDLNYVLIPDRPERDNYASFYIRNGSNQYLVLPYKDGLEVKAMGKGTYNYYMAYRPVAVHINGGFFGIYELREKLNGDFLESNYGMNTDSMDLIGVSYFKGMWLQPIEGSIEPFESDFLYFMGLSPTAPDFLDDVSTFLDIDNYTDYIIAESWIGNNDWPQNNIKIFRCPSTGFRWHFMLVDLEWALRPNQWTTSEFDAIGYILNHGTSLAYTAFWYRMMQNNSYKYHFINRYADLMNTRYSFEVIGLMEEEIYNEALPEMPAEYERWGTSDIQGQMSNFTSNHEIFRSELEIRSSRVRQHLQNHFGMDRQVTIELEVVPEGTGRIRISTITPDTYPWTGIYFSNIPITVQAVPYPGYRLKGWDENHFIENLSDISFTSTISDATTIFTANFEKGSDDFDGITISEINYKDGVDFNTTDWFEIFNSTGVDLDMTGWYFTDKDPDHRFNFVPGTSIPAGERLVVARDLNNFMQNYPGVRNLTGGFNFGLGTPVDLIKLFSATGEMMLSVSYSIHYPWPLEDDTEGRTLELVDPEMDLNDPGNWFAGCIGGSPGMAWTDCDSVMTGEEYSIIGSTGIIKGLTAYPNPAAEVVNVGFYLEHQADELEIMIYNMLGEQVALQRFDEMKPGWQTLEVDLTAIRETGLLLLRVSSGDYTEAVKIIRE